MPTCLIVDDSATMRKIAHKFLSNLGFACSEAVDGAEALAKARLASPDLVLLDWEMPVLDGFATLQALRSEAWDHSPRVVMCTTLNDMDQIIAAMQAGADEYVMKPYDQDILAEKLRTIGLLA